MNSADRTNPAADGVAAAPTDPRRGAPPIGAPGAVAVAALCVALALLLRPSRGIWTWLLLAAECTLCAFLASAAARRLPAALRPEGIATAVRRLGVAGAGVLVVLAAAEAGLAVHEAIGRSRLAAGERTYPFLTLPPELDRVWLAPIEGRHAYTWLGKLHVVDANLMRRTTPVPPRRPDVCRVMVVGDSNTFGQAVAVEDAYPAVLERALESSHRVEVLNLGVKGYNSGDVLARVEEYVPRLEPDLVVYGVCLNDYLGSGAGLERPSTDRGPLAAALHALEGRTRAAKVIGREWDDALIGVGVRPGLFGEVIEGMAQFEPRFTREVAAMNRVVVASGRPPVVAMVVNQFPATSGPSFELTMRAERTLRDAGFDVVGISAFLAAEAGRPLSVGRFDGHPNEEAHRLFAALLAERLREHPALQRFRR